MAEPLYEVSRMPCLMFGSPPAEKDCLDYSSFAWVARSSRQCTVNSLSTFRTYWATLVLRGPGAKDRTMLVGAFKMEPQSALETGITPNVDVLKQHGLIQIGQDMRRETSDSKAHSQALATVR